MHAEKEFVSQFLSDEMVSQIRQRSREAERLGSLHPDQLTILHQTKLFKMFVPRHYGGLGCTLPEILQAEEALAWADGSTGWVVTLCSGAAWFVGFVEPDIVTKFFRDDHLCIAGSGAVTGVAEMTGGSFEISGIWKYASGALHATAFTANCYIKKDGQFIVDEQGLPKISAFILPKEDVTVHNTWNSMGMIATGSHSFEVRNLRVSSSQCFQIDAATATANDLIFRYPFLQLAETTLAVNLSGMAMRFIDLTEQILQERARGKRDLDWLNNITSLRIDFNKTRKSFFEVTVKSWECLASQQTLDHQVLNNVSSNCKLLVRHARQVVNELYPKCGLVAANFDLEINRVWRNFHTASQHTLFGT